MFVNDLVVKRNVSADNSWILMEPLVWEDSQVSITINEGFDFDFASSPQTPLLGWMFPKSGTSSDRPACLHDALYASEYFPRAMCDQLFLDAMKSDGVGYAKRYAMYWAVRGAGWTVWKGHNRDEVEDYKKFVTVVSNVVVGL